MLKMALAGGLLLLYGCATAQSPDAYVDRCGANVNAQYQSGQISRLDRAKGYRDCNLSAYPGDPYRQEYWDYFVYIASEFTAGRISEEQGKALISQKETQIIERRTSMIQSMQPAQPQPLFILPSCRSLPPGTAGYARSQGQCY